MVRSTLTKGTAGIIWRTIVRYKSVNPLFMKYTPTEGKFSGQLGYGYRSFEAFIDAVAAVNSGLKTVSSYDHSG